MLPFLALLIMLSAARYASAEMVHVGGIGFFLRPRPKTLSFDIYSVKAPLTKVPITALFG